MDLDKVLISLNEGSFVKPIEPNENDAAGGMPTTDEKPVKDIRITTAVSKGFIESFVGSLPDKVGKDVKARLGGSFGKQMTVEAFIKALGDIIGKGNMTQMVSLKDVGIGNKATE